MTARQESIGFLLASVSHLMRRAFSERREDGALTLAQARALFYVSRNEGMRQIDLAELLEVKPITLARLIDQLAEAGLVERRADPDDRRAYRIFLTPTAAPHLESIEAVAASVRADALRGLGKQDVATLFAALRAMRDNLASR